MKTKLIFFSFIFFLIFVSCKKEEPSDSGIIEIRLTTWNSEMSESKQNNILRSGDTNTVYLIDTRKDFLQLKVTTDEITEGVPDNFDWITIYQSNQTMLDSQRGFQFELPQGNYQGIGILQSNAFAWICMHQGDTVELLDMNDNSQSPSTLIYNIFNPQGLFVLGANNFLEGVDNNEKLGTFQILPGKKTIVTIRVNIVSMDWFDNDGDGEWSEGDQIDNWMLPEGITTMADFIVEYQDK